MKQAGEMLAVLALLAARMVVALGSPCFPSYSTLSLCEGREQGGRDRSEVSLWEVELRDVLAEQQPPRGLLTPAGFNTTKQHLVHDQMGSFV